MAGLLDVLFNGGAEKEAAEKNRALYDDYRAKGTEFLDKGFSGAKGALDSAIGSFTPLADLGKKYGGASTLLLDALGVNGADGSARATGAFQASPGYQFNLEQGLEALNRRRAAGGMLDSGNADIDAIRFGTGLADSEFGNWLTRLGSFVSPELSATSGAATGTAAGYGSLANLHQADATNRIGLQGNFTSGMAGANNLEAAGEAKGAGNLLNLGMNLGKMAMGSFF